MISKTELQKLLKENNFPVFRWKQIFHALYREGKSDWNEMKVLPERERIFLRGHCPVYSFSVEREVVSPSRNVRKTLFRLHDGKLVEGVLMRFDDGRNSVCVSSQVGCGLKCGFCATGTMGFSRNLTESEISDQVMYFGTVLKTGSGAQRRVDHVVFMGMGEPFLNYDAVLAACRCFNDADAFGIAARRITISTSGIVPGILKLAKEPEQFNLAVSLHAPNQELRARLMPIAKAYPLNALISAIKKYIEATGRRVSYEYVMLKNQNDSPELARELGSLLKGQMCHVNCIPYNQTYLGFENSGKSRIDEFAEIVRSYDIPVTVRVSLGQDISAACGQLAVAEPKKP